MSGIRPVLDLLRTAWLRMKSRTINPLAPARSADADRAGLGRPSEALMKHCTGMMGRLCTCGLWHADGGRQVDTQRDEAPRPVPITLADDGGVLTQEGVSALAGPVFWALVAAGVLGAAGLVVLIRYLAG